MKNMVKMFGLVAVVAMVSGCADEGCRRCGQPVLAPAEPVYQAQPCGDRVTREPVEVIYRRTTYRTVYEPKTTSAVSYEREAYRGQGCSNCGGNTVSQNSGYYY